MKTEVLPVGRESIARASELLRAGQLVAFPTETVYGLGANALDGRAVEGIFRAKERPADNPLIAHIANVDGLEGLIDGEPSAAARALMDAYWPGPMTLIFKRLPGVPDVVTASLNTVAVRLPAHAAARALIEECGFPIAAPSANRSGRPSPTTAAHVYEDMAGRVPLILDGGHCAVGLESTVIDATGDVPRVLRPGGVTPEMIAAVTGGAEVDGAVLRPLMEGETARSPGMKYRHYAPRGRVTIVEGDAESVARRICSLYDAAGEGARILALTGHAPLYGDRKVIPLGVDAAAMAGELFAALRELDAEGASDIFSEAVPPDGIGLAVMNRLERAAAFNVIKA